MNFTTFYFSGTGNTRWAVKEFHRIIETRGHQGKFYAIEDRELDDPAVLDDIFRNCDYISFAHPIYGANVPPIMRNFIKGVRNLLIKEKDYKKPIYIINTFGYINAFGPFEARKLFADTGLEVISYINIKIYNNISTPQIKTKAVDKAKLTRRKAKAQVKMAKMADKVIAGQRYVTGIRPYLIPGKFIRKKSAQGIQENYKSLSVDPQTCKKCFKCLKNCPTYSILMQGEYADPTIYHRYRGPE